MCRIAHTNTHTHTRFTQVRGPREEVKPLLLLLVLIYVVTNRVTEELLELYASYWKIRQVFSSSVYRPSRRRAWGALYSSAPGYSVRHSHCGHTPWSPSDTHATAPCRDRVSAGRHGPLCPGQASQHASHCYVAPPGSADMVETYPALDSRAPRRRALLCSVLEGAWSTVRDSFHPA